jgi:hypothetical protein
LGETAKGAKIAKKAMEEETLRSLRNPLFFEGWIPARIPAADTPFRAKEASFPADPVLVQYVAGYESGGSKQVDFI